MNKQREELVVFWLRDHAQELPNIADLVRGVSEFFEHPEWTDDDLHWIWSAAADALFELEVELGWVA